MSYRTKQKPILLKRGRNRKTRLKTFKSEESANKYASDNKIESYVLENLRNSDSKQKKIRIIAK